MYVEWIGHGILERLSAFLYGGVGVNKTTNKVTNCQNILLLSPIANQIHKDTIFYTVPQQHF
jgi:hypothetical protein